MSDLRGSGAIEEDAAAVMLLYPDKSDRARTLASGTFAKGPVKSWLKVDKNRFGMQGLYLPLMHLKAFTKFEDTTAKRRLREQAMIPTSSRQHRNGACCLNVTPIRALPIIVRLCKYHGFIVEKRSPEALPACSCGACAEAQKVRR